MEKEVKFKFTGSLDIHTIGVIRGFLDAIEAAADLTTEPLHGEQAPAPQQAKPKYPPKKDGTPPTLPLKVFIAEQGDVASPAQIAAIDKTINNGIKFANIPADLKEEARSYILNQMLTGDDFPTVQSLSKAQKSGVSKIIEALFANKFSLVDTLMKEFKASKGI